MNRSFLIFGIALLALMAGALFYAARIPVEQTQTTETADAAAQPAVTTDGEGADRMDALPPSMTGQEPTIVDYPEFTLVDLDGEERDFAEFAGRHRMLNFWATWCAPCRREIPLLKTFQDEQGDEGILVMGIAVDFFEDVQVYAEAAEFNYPILIGEEDAMAVAETSGVQFIAMPFTMFVSREGQFLGAYLGELHREQLNDIDNIFSRLDAGDIDVDEAKGAFALL